MKAKYLIESLLCLLLIIFIMPVQVAFGWTYTVFEGDSYASVAELTQTDIDELQAANPDIKSLKAGIKLNIPDCISTTSLVESYDMPDLLQPTSDEPIIPYTEEELDLLARCVFAEAGGEKYEGKVAVAAVVVNRVLNEGFPDTITDVIYEPKQFTCVTNGAINKKATASCYNAALAALHGADNTYGALFFWAPTLTESKYHESLSYICTIGCHIFASDNKYHE